MPVPSDNLTNNNITDRPNYYAGQYLLEDDFELEQQYHLDRLRRHHRLLHVAGIVHGLVVSWADGDAKTKLQVKMGTAIDGDGRQIVLSQDKRDVAPLTAISNDAGILVIRYESTEFSNQGATDGNNRIKEEPVLAWETATPLPTGAIPLAKVTGTGQAKNLDLSVRVYSGIRLPSPLNTLGQGLTLRYKGNGQAPTGTQAELAEFTGTLAVKNGDLLISKPTAQSNTPEQVVGQISFVGFNRTVNSASIVAQSPSWDDQSHLIFLTSSSGTGATEKLRITHDGKVGIGTTTPNEKLEVSGSLKATNATLTGTLSVTQASTLTGNVSMGGTLAVTGTSTLTGNVSMGGDLILKASSGNDAGDLIFQDSGGTQKGRIWTNTSLGAGLNLSSGDNVADITIDADGKVGIGTPSPASKLHIDKGRVDITASDGAGGGQNRFSGLLARTSDNGRSQLVLSSGYSDLVIASSQGNNIHGSTLTFATYDPANATDYRKWVINQGNWGTRKQFLEFGYADAANPNPHDYISDANTVLTLDGVNKRVGIGTRTPSEKLEIQMTGVGRQQTNFLSIYTDDCGAEHKSQIVWKNGPDRKLAAAIASRPGSAYNAGDLRFQTAKNGSLQDRMIIDADGNVGIGTTTTLTEKLEVNGNLKATNATLTGTLSVTQASTLTGNVSMGGDLILKASSGNDAGDLIFQDSGGTQKGRIWTNPSSGAGLNLSSGDNVADITIDADGKVGIGTTRPGATLEINGDIKATGNLIIKDVSVPQIKTDSDFKTDENAIPTVKAIVGLLQNILPPQQRTIYLGNDVILEMVFIPGGQFLMGSDDGKDSEKPVHRVTVPPFYMGKYPVTQEQYQTIVGSNPSSFKEAKCPVEMVSFNEAKGFCDRLYQRTGTLCRLPSEAEWEYACRAGTTTKYYFGDNVAQLGEFAWYSENSEAKTKPVGQKKPNRFGLYDMHGNVLEYCLDQWHDNYQGAPNDGGVWKTGGKPNSYILRGGSWYTFNLMDLRSANRGYNEIIGGADKIGFRVVYSATWTL